MRHVRSLVVLGLLGSFAAARAEVDQPLTDKLNDLANWKVAGGDWQTVNGRIRGKGDSTLEFQTPLPAKFTLSFKFNVIDGMRPRIFFQGTGLTVGNEGYTKAINAHGKYIKNRTGEPLEYKNGDTIACSVSIDRGAFVLKLNDQVVRGKCSKPDSIRLSIRGGDNYSKGTVEYWDFRLDAAAGSTDTPGDADKSDQPAKGVVVKNDGSVAVPSGEAGQANDLPAAPADPSAIERPEFAKVPKPLVKSQTSVTSMMVSIGDDGDASGIAADIIATVPPASRDGDSAGIGFTRADGDSTMKVSLDEAVRAVTMRYPVWEPGQIKLSFGEKFVNHGGPSAGTAFGLLMLSTLEGFDLDPKCAVTGDITVDWRVRKVGGVTAKLRGATLAGCKLACIPTDNRTAFADMGLLYGRDSYWKLQVFGVDTMQDAVAIARKDRASKLQEAIDAFAALGETLDKSEAALRTPATKATLQKVLDLAPNHLSAQNLLAVASGTAPTKLSGNATLYKFSILMYPYRTLGQNGKPADKDYITQTLTPKTKKRINALRPIADKAMLPLINSADDLIDALDKLAKGRMTLEQLKAKAAKLDAKVDEMASDEKFGEKIVHEGY